MVPRIYNVFIFAYAARGIGGPCKVRAMPIACAICDRLRWAHCCVWCVSCVLCAAGLRLCDRDCSSHNEKTIVACACACINIIFFWAACDVRVVCCVENGVVPSGGHVRTSAWVIWAHDQLCAATERERVYVYICI